MLKGVQQMQETTITTIAKNIKKYRLLNQLTQEQLASKLNMDTQYYAQVERGERKFTLEKVILACQVLRVNIQDIIEIPIIEQRHDKETLKKIQNYLDGANDSQLFLIEKFITEILPYIK